MTEDAVAENVVPAGYQELRSMSVLPAVREDVEFTTADGLTLVGELALPVGREPVATLVTLHPLPTHGGFMDSHVYRKAAWRLPHLADYAVLRFNTRGTTSPRGTSDGSFDEGVGERNDVLAAVEFAKKRGLPNLWLVGWSFGTELTLKYGPEVDVNGAILLSPPLHRATDQNIANWVATGRPLTVLVPELDEFLNPEQAAPHFRGLPGVSFIDVPEAKHLWVGERFVRIVLDEVVRAITPDRSPLPTSLPEGAFQ